MLVVIKREESKLLKSDLHFFHCPDWALSLPAPQPPEASETSAQTSDLDEKQ